MEGITLLIAVVALVLSILAYQRTGGTSELKRQFESQHLFRRSEETDGGLDGDDRFLERENGGCPGPFREAVRKTEKGD